MTSRAVLHVDLDAFYCSVEETLDPALRGRAFVVGGSADGRGVVSSASYPARVYGVRSAMPTAQAVRLCPDLLVLRGHFNVYGKISREIMTLLRASTPVVEQLSVDEAFLDVTDDPRPGRSIAEALQGEISAQFDLPSSWGIAGNKLVAKIATEVGKPRGVIDVPRGGAADFLAPLPVGMLWGVGPVTRSKLEELGVRTIGDLARIDAEGLSAAFGRRGPELKRHALGLDDSPVVEGRDAKSISAETTFRRDVSDGSELRRTLLALTEQVGHRLRKSGLAGSTVRLKLRWPDFTTLSRQTQLDQPSDQDREIHTAVLSLFERVWRKSRPVRLLGVGVGGLGPPIRQLSLFDAAWEEDERLLAAIDHIRARYGLQAVRRAATLLPPEGPPSSTGPDAPAFPGNES